MQDNQVPVEMFRFDKWEAKFIERLQKEPLDSDPAHDFSHLCRVVLLAKQLAHEEGARLDIVVPAAWFHDLVNLPKNHPERHLASTYSADRAIEFLRSIDYPAETLDEIHHAIRAHSFSAKVEPQTLEAKVVQDADRLDAIGAIGIARCLMTGGCLRRAFYDFDDPFGLNRSWNDSKYSLDHFFVKLLKVGPSCQTRSGRKEGKKRTSRMKTYLNHLKKEIGFTA